MNSITIPTLNARPNYGAAVAEELRNKAERQRAARMDGGPNWRRRVAHLERLAAAVKAEPEMDSRVLCALGDIQRAQFTLRRPDDRERWRASRWTPTPLQERVLLGLGEDSFPPVSEIFAELIAAGIRDIREVAHRTSAAAAGRDQQAGKDRQDLEAKLDDARVEVSRLEGVAVERDELREELAEQRAANEELAGMVDALRAADAEGDAESASGEESPRRTKVGETGIYKNRAGNLEISWREDGHTRWRALPGGATLEEARAARAEATGQEAGPLDLEAVFDALQVELGHELTDEEIAAVEAAVDEAAGGESAEDVAARLVKSLRGGADKATAKSTSAKGR